MNRIKALALGPGIAMSFPALALAQAPTLSFSGFADHTGAGAGLYGVGVAYEAYLVADTAPGSGPYAYPYDSLFEYTMVIQTTVDAWTVLGETRYSVHFAPATFSIYEDDLTAADWADRTTFTDGQPILSGTVTFPASEIRYDTGGNLPLALALGPAHVVITGGTGAGNSLCTTFIGNDFITIRAPFGGPEPGYLEGFDVLWNGNECDTATDGPNWGMVKSLYR